MSFNPFFVLEQRTDLIEDTRRKKGPCFQANYQRNAKWAHTHGPDKRNKIQNFSMKKKMYHRLCLSQLFVCYPYYISTDCNFVHVNVNSNDINYYKNHTNIRFQENTEDCAVSSVTTKRNLNRTEPLQSNVHLTCNELKFLSTNIEENSAVDRAKFVISRKLHNIRGYWQPPHS